MEIHGKTSLPLKNNRKIFPPTPRPAQRIHLSLQKVVQRTGVWDPPPGIIKIDYPAGRNNVATQSGLWIIIHRNQQSWGGGGGGFIIYRLRLISTR